MIRSVWLIRHGESTANAGAITDSHDKIPLTTTGYQQAIQVASLIPQRPELVVTSSFLRTQQTAYPTLQRFPRVRQECWPVHEFTYLAPSTCIGTTAIQRRERVNAYWERNDPDHVDGEGAESFNAMLGRIKQMLERLRQESSFVIIFTHGQIMLATRLLLESPNIQPEALMKLFRHASPIQNTEIMPLSF